MSADSRRDSVTGTDETGPARIPGTPERQKRSQGREPCDDGRHVVVLDEHGAGRCACGMVTRYPKETTT